MILHQKQYQGSNSEEWTCCHYRAAIADEWGQEYKCIRYDPSIIILAIVAVLWLLLVSIVFSVTSSPQPFYRTLSEQHSVTDYCFGDFNRDLYAAIERKSFLYLTYDLCLYEGWEMWTCVLLGCIFQFTDLLNTLNCLYRSLLLSP